MTLDDPSSIANKSTTTIYVFTWKKKQNNAFPCIGYWKQTSKRNFNSRLIEKHTIYIFIIRNKNPIKVNDLSITCSVCWKNVFCRRRQIIILIGFYGDTF